MANYPILEEHTLVDFLGYPFFIQEVEYTLHLGKEPIIKHIVLSQVEGMEMEEDGE